MLNTDEDNHITLSANTLLELPLIRPDHLIKALIVFRSMYPKWMVKGLRAGVGVTLKVAAHNARGRSDVIRFEVHTASAQQHNATPSMSSMVICLFTGFKIS